MTGEIELIVLCMGVRIKLQQGYYEAAQPNSFTDYP